MEEPVGRKPTMEPAEWMTMEKLEGTRDGMDWRVKGRSRAGGPEGHRRIKRLTEQGGVEDSENLMIKGQRQR